MSVEYMVKTVAAAAHLLATCDDTDLADAVMTRVTQMMNRAWDFHYHGLERDYVPMVMNAAIKRFWNSVSQELVTTQPAKVYSFQAVFGEEVNPPGQVGNVHISFQALNSIQFYVTKLSVVAPVKNAVNEMKG